MTTSGSGGSWPAVAMSDAFTIYSAGDVETRAAIDRFVEIQIWERKQSKYLDWAGLALGFGVAVLFLLKGVELINDGHDTAGVLISGVDLVALVTVFVVRRPRSNSQSS